MPVAKKKIAHINVHMNDGFELHIVLFITLSI